ncbi:MAG: LPS export ABC transporter permease LptG [Gammaproteobacteria bacterium]|nr:LPS export ABC transporter permease LptG [Gammaproteobacteria bacterium]
MNRIDRYVLRAVLGGVLLVMTVLLSLGALFVLLGQQDDIGVGRYTVWKALAFVGLNLPQQVWEMLPISALIGSLLGLGALARGSELTVMRAAGLSVWQIGRGVVLAGLLLLAFGVAVGEWLAPPMQQLGREVKAFAKFSNVSFAGSGDAWVRDGDLIVNVERQTGDSQFGGMMVYELGPDNRLQSMGRAATAREVGSVAKSVAKPGGGREAASAWRLEQYAETRFDGDCSIASSSAGRTLESNVGAEFLGIAATIPGQLPSTALWRMIRHLKTNGLDSREPVFAFHSRIARTVAVLFAVLLALPFVFGSMRSAGAGARIGLGLMLGIVFFLLQQMIESGAIVYGGDPALFAWLPTMLMAAAATVLIARTR